MGVALVVSAWSTPCPGVTGRSRPSSLVCAHHRPLVLDGSMTGEVFRAYVEQMLAPALQSGDVVVMDNLAAHNVERCARGDPSRRGERPLSADLQPRP